MITLDPRYSDLLVPCSDCGAPAGDECTNFEPRRAHAPHRTRARASEIRYVAALENALDRAMDTARAMDDPRVAQDLRVALDLQLPTDLPGSMQDPLFDLPAITGPRIIQDSLFKFPAAA